MFNTSSVLAMRCANCGKMEQVLLSLFSFSHDKQAVFRCECGQELARLSTKQRRNFWLQYPCALCEKNHITTFVRSQIWGNKNARRITCEDTGIDVGYVGSRDKVRERIHKGDHSLLEMAEKLGMNDFFSNAAVMVEIMERVHDLAEQGKLTCQCGNVHIEMDIYPDYLAFFCEKCQSEGILRAGKEEDLFRIRKLWKMKLTKGGFLYYRSDGYNNQKHR